MQISAQKRSNDRSQKLFDLNRSRDDVTWLDAGKWRDNRMQQRHPKPKPIVIDVHQSVDEMMERVMRILKLMLPPPIYQWLYRFLNESPWAYLVKNLISLINDLLHKHISRKDYYPTTEKPATEKPVVPQPREDDQFLKNLIDTIFNPRKSKP